MDELTLRCRLQSAHEVALHATWSRESALSMALVVFAEDVIVHGVLCHGAPLALSTWRGQTGLSELPPLACPEHRLDWARRVRCDPAALKAYAHAVHRATDTHLAQTDVTALQAPAVCVLEAVVMSYAGLRG